jgi:hypothetical protein
MLRLENGSIRIDKIGHRLVGLLGHSTAATKDLGATTSYLKETTR